MIGRDGAGGWVLDGFGGVHTFGAAAAPAAPAHYAGRDLYQQLHRSGDSLYTVERWGVAAGLGAPVAAAWGGYADWGAWDILRDLVLVDAADPGGGAQPVSAEAARALRMHADRYTMDVPTFRQTRSLDCEAAALQVALAALGTSVTQDWIIAAIGSDERPPELGPGGAVTRWGDPYTTFVGRIDGSEPLHTGYGVSPHRSPPPPGPRAAPPRAGRGGTPGRSTTRSPSAIRR